VMSPNEPVAGRACGGCTLCCKVLGITALNKPQGKWCTHCKPGNGCGIYQDRPDECRTFLCNWLVDERLGAEWKPDRSRLVVTNTKDMIEVRCDPGYPAAWRKEPYYSQIRAWAQAARQQQGIVLIFVGDSRTLIAPEGEFPLGRIRVEDLVLEFSGDRLTGVRLEQGSGIRKG